MSGDEIGTVNEAKAFHTLLNSARVSQGNLDEVETAKDPNINSECPIGPKQQSNILTAINNQIEQTKDNENKNFLTIPTIEQPNSSFI